MIGPVKIVLSLSFMLIASDGSHRLCQLFVCGGSGFTFTPTLYSVEASSPGRTKGAFYRDWHEIAHVGQVKERAGRRSERAAEHL
jgi:hypothetical protein